MTDKDDVQPSEQRGGTTPGEEESERKGPWAARAAEGVVPPELGGSDATDDLLDDDPELGSGVLGATTGSNRPATESGIDRGAGDEADATSNGGAVQPAGDEEPDLRDAAAGARQVDRDAAS